METTYRVLIKGVKPSADANSVRENIAKLFKISDEAAGRVLEAKNHIVKGGLTAGRAAQYHTAIEAAGANCIVESETQNNSDIQLAPSVIEKQAQAPMPGTERKREEVFSDVSAGLEQPSNQSPALKYVGGFLIVVVVLGFVGNYWIRTTRPSENDTQKVLKKPAKNTVLYEAKDLIGVLTCGDMTIELFSDNTFIRGSSSDEHMAFGNFRLKGDRLFMETTANKFPGLPYISPDWQKALQAEKVERSNHVIQEDLIVEKSADHLLFKSVRVTNWDGISKRSMSDLPPWNCTRDQTVQFAGVKDSVPEYLKNKALKPPSADSSAEGNDTARVVTKGTTSGNAVIGLASNKQAVYYNFAAKSGTHISLTVESEGNVVAFHLYPPEASFLIAQNVVPPNRITNEPMRRFDHQVTESGTYIVGVGFPRNEKTESAKFKLSVSSDSGGVGDLMAGLGDSGEAASGQSSIPKASSSGCAFNPSDVTATINQVRAARERALQAITVAESRSDYCRSVAGILDKGLFIEADRTFVSIMKRIDYQVSHGLRADFDALVLVCPSYEVVERQLSNCRK